MHEADRIGELHSVMVIPRPLEDLEETLPTASYWIEQPISLPISLPISIKETQKELVPQAEKLEMPDLRQLAEPEPLRLSEAVQPEILKLEVTPSEAIQPEVLPPERLESTIRAKPMPPDETLE